MFICQPLQLQNYLCLKNYVQNPRLPLQNYEITLHVTDLFTHTIVARRESRLVKTIKAVFVFRSDLHSSYANAFIAISRSNKTNNYPGKSFDVLNFKLYVLCRCCCIFFFGRSQNDGRREWTSQIHVNRAPRANDFRNIATNSSCNY